MNACHRMLLRHNFRSLCLSVSIGFLVLVDSAGVLRADILLPERRITWAPGIRGHIPNRTSLIDVTTAPYNADPNGSQDSSNAIQSAINAAGPGQVVYLPAGTYVASSTLTVLNNGDLTIRGDGPAKTIIKYIGSSDAIDVMHWSSSYPLVSIKSGYTKGSKSLIVADASSLVVGATVVIRQSNSPTVTAKGDDGLCGWCGDDNPGSVMTQVDMVTAISGNTITLERPIYLSFAAELNPRVQRWDMIKGVGIENLQIWRSNRNATHGSNLNLHAASGCWIQNIKSVMAGNSHIRLADSYACQIRGSELIDGWNHGSDASYGVWMFGWNSEHLIENNIISRCRHSLVYEGGGSGCVCAYNYCFDGFNEDGDWLSEDMDTHGAHPYMNLSEGNIFTKLSHDNTWGSSSYNTTFRCWITDYSSATASRTYGRWAIDIQAHNPSNNVIGCLVGRPGDSGMQFATASTSTGTASAYRLGFWGPVAYAPYDRSVQETTFLHGSYDFISDKTIWDPANSDHSLPDSLYLAAKPSWWGSLRWPAFGPDLNPKIGAIPAEARYRAATKN